MAQSSPEGITLGKGSQLVSMELSINKEKVLSTKQEKLYTEEDLLNFGAFVRIEVETGVIKLDSGKDWEAK